MKFQIVTVMLALLFLESPVRAQRLSGFIFGAPGIFTQEFTYDIASSPRGGYEIRRRTIVSGHFGGGVSWNVNQSVGLAAEAGAVTLDGYPTGAVSLNGLYRFRTGRPIVPFITGGYTRISTLNGFNVGAGVDYWAGERWGVKFEIRVHRLNDEPQYDFKGHPLLSEFRAGLNFR
jgi:opacity protein-like surface antigen